MMPAENISAQSAGTIVQFPCRQDNYGFLIADRESRRAAAIDTPDPDGVLKILAAEGWKLEFILNTQWHEDHIGGNEELKKATGARVIAPAVERARIPSTDVAIQDGAVIFLGTLIIHAIETAGHTLGHMSYYLPELDAVFTGDALFVMGCGRLFEGSPELAWRGLCRLVALPSQTKLYCAHEYGSANAAFAQSFSGEIEITARAAAIALMRAAGRPTVPSTIGLEKRTNPFLSLPLAAQRLGGDIAAIEQFAVMRRDKDDFM